MDAPPDAPLPITSGDTTIEMQGPGPAGWAPMSPEVVWAMMLRRYVPAPYYATQSGVVNQLVVYYAPPTDDATALIVGLYTDNGVNPGTLLAGGTIAPGGQLAKQTWHTLQIPETAIAANTFYWIAVACPGGSGNACSVQYKYYGMTGVGPCTPMPMQQCTQHSAQSNLTVMPATWSPGAVFFPCINSYYATHD